MSQTVLIINNEDIRKQESLLFIEEKKERDQQKYQRQMEINQN